MEKEIQIRDYELRESIEMLFRLPVYIYGAGEAGKEIEYLMSCAGMDVRCFIDKRAGEIQRNRRVINIDLFRDECKPQNGECIVILALEFDCGSLLEELRKRGIFVRHVYTKWAAEMAILSNLDDDRYPKDLRQKYINIKWQWKRTALSRTLEKNMWIWQPGKVGSSTVYATLRKYEIDCLQIHNIVRLMQEEEIDNSSLLEKIKKEPMKIITLVREPIARDISDYMQNYYLHCIYKETVLDVLAEFAETNHQFRWYDWEIKALLGIDIFEYPFDRERGYGYIKKNNIEILILKLETLDKSADVLGKFVGLDNIVLERVNEGDKKAYHKLYQDIRDNIVLPQRIVDLYYRGNERMDHFYTEEEKQRFLQKYKVQAISI